MSDIFFPQWFPPSRMSWGYDDFTAADESATTGAVQTSTLYGTRRWRVRMDFDVLTRSDGSLPVFEGLLASLRGRANRVWFSDVAHQRRGAFPASELLSNNTFANGTVGWVAGSTDWSISVTDRTLRMSRIAMTTAGAALQASAALTLVQYAPYAIRFAIQQGRGSTIGGFGGGYSGVTNFDSSTSYGLYSRGGAVSQTSVTPLIYNIDTAGMLAGFYFSIPYISLSRCALVDNAANLFLQSNTFSNAAWAKTNVTAADNAASGPDGIGNMAVLTETAVNGQHSAGQAITVSSVAQDIFLGFVITALSRSFARVYMNENTGVTAAGAYFNFATGLVGTTATGANWSNLRTGMLNLGAGYYYCWIIARKTNAATSISGFAGAATADGTDSYLGVAATQAIGVEYGTLSASSVAARFSGAQTAAATSPSGTAQTGSSLYVKGLPASTAGLGKIGDFVQIVMPTNSQLVRLTASLDSDAAGLGYMQFEPALKQSPADNAAVIFQEPMGRFMLAAGSVGVELTPGVFGKASLDFVEAP